MVLGPTLAYGFCIGLIGAPSGRHSEVIPVVEAARHSGPITGIGARSFGRTERPTT